MPATLHLCRARTFRSAAAIVLGLLALAPGFAAAQEAKAEPLLEKVKREYPEALKRLEARDKQIAGVARVFLAYEVGTDQLLEDRSVVEFALSEARLRIVQRYEPRGGQRIDTRAFIVNGEAGHVLTKPAGADAFLGRRSPDTRAAIKSAESTFAEWIFPTRLAGRYPVTSFLQPAYQMTDVVEETIDGTHFYKITFKDRIDDEQAKNRMPVGGNSTRFLRGGWVRVAPAQGYALHDFGVRNQIVSAGGSHDNVTLGHVTYRTDEHGDLVPQRIDVQVVREPEKQATLTGQVTVEFDRYRYGPSPDNVFDPDEFRKPAVEATPAAKDKE